MTVAVVAVIRGLPSGRSRPLRQSNHACVRCWIGMRLIPIALSGLLMLLSSARRYPMGQLHLAEGYVLSKNVSRLGA